MNEQGVVAGQIWREVDPRFKRRVLVMAVSAKFGVLIRNVKSQPGSKGRWARIDRFNGKRGGYVLDTEAEFK